MRGLRFTADRAYNVRVTTAPRIRKRKRQSADAREESRAALTAMCEARDAFWDRALCEEWEPGETDYRHIRKAWTGLPDLPDAYTLAGCNPGVWCEDAQRSPEMRKWRKARDLAWATNFGLVSMVCKRKIAPRRNGATHEDAYQEEIWAEARIGLLRGVDLWSPEATIEGADGKLRAPAPSTYLSRWVLQGAGKTQNRARKDAARKDALAPDDFLCTDVEQDFWAAEDRMIAALDSGELGAY